jgi:hypothetical protein
MQFGGHLPMFGPVATRENVLRFAGRMEGLGYDSLWASDHDPYMRALASEALRKIGPDR